VQDEGGLRVLLGYFSHPPAFFMPQSP
jgi:hypothetical protein